MAIGRISGSVLKSNLTRNGTDLAFETNLLYLDVTNSRVGIGTSEPTATLHVNGNTNITGNLTGVTDVTASGTTQTDIIKNREQRYTTSNMMKFNQLYTGASLGSYFSANEYQKVVTITPSGDSQNYQVIGRITAQNAGETHVVNFNAALRSNTLPDLDWSIFYDEDYNGSRYIDPQLWTKETTTAGFIFTFKTLATIYGTVTVDFDVIPRTSALLSNVSINTTQDSEQTSIDSGFTARDMTRVVRKQSSNINVNGSVTATAFAGDGSQLTGINVDTNIQLVGDDSTGATLGTGETFKIAGGTNITTAVSGDTLTVTGPDLSSYITASSTDTLTNKTFDANGTGNSLSNIEVSDFASGEVLDEDNMASDSATKLATQQSIKAYVDSQVTAQDLDFQADSGGALSIDLDSETMTFTGGTGIDTSGSGNAVTFAIDSTVATLTGSQTLTNKTLTTPVISSISNTGTITLPTSTDTLVGRATTDTLTNKTLTSPTINGFSGTGNGTITGTLSIDNTTTGDTLLLTTTEASSTAAPVLTFKRNSDSPADADYLGQLKFKGENDADQEVIYAKMTGKISDASDTTEDGLIEFALRKAGSNNIGARLTSTELKLINGTGLEVAGLTYPTSDGSAGQVLKTDGSGNLSFTTISTNSVSQGDSNVTVTDSGTGAITVAADGGTIITMNATTVLDASAVTNAIRLPNGTTAQRPSGAVGEIRYNSSTDTIEGYTSAGGWAQLGATSSTSENTNDTTTGNATAISTTEKIINQFTIGSFDSAWYLTVTRDEINDQVATAKHSLAHNDSTAVVSTSHITRSDATNSFITVDADVTGGNARLKATGTSVVNSVSFYRIALGDNTSAGTTGNVTNVINTDVDSASESIDSWDKASYRAAKYYISVNNASKTEVSNLEALVVHDGTTAYITSYGATNTGSNDLINLTAAISGSNVVVSATGNEPNLRVTAYRILLADDESASTGDNINIVAATNVSSTATTVDSFVNSAYTGAFYVFTGYNATEGAASAAEVMVVSNDEAYIAVGPTISTKGTDQLTFSATQSGSTVTVKAASTSGASTTVNGYRVHMLRGSAGASTADTVLVSTEQTITGQKTFTAGVLTDTIQSPASNADITLDPQGTGVVRIKSNILPDVNTTYDIGSDSLRFNDIYLSGNTVNLGGTKIQRTSDGDVEFKDASNNRKTVIVEQIELGTGADRVKLSKRADGGLKITDNTDSRVEILKIVGDDSSGNGLFSGETFKFAGTGGISTSVTDDVLTIDGSAISAGTEVVGDTTPQLGGQLDVNGNALGDGTLELLKFSETASAVNELTITNAATGNGPQLSATGDDTNIDLKLTTKGTGAIVATGNVVPEANGTRDLGSASNRWANIYTSDLNLNNGIGNYTIVEGEDDLFLYNNKSGKTYKFMLAEVDPNTVPKKMEE